MVVDTLNANSGAIIGIATTFLVIVTLALVIATWQLVKVNKRMMLSQDKPWLYFYTAKKESQVYGNPSPIINYLYVKNVGKGAALKIRFTVNLDNQSSPITETRPDDEFSLSPNEELRITKLPNSHGDVSIENICYLDINEEKRYQKEVPITY